MADGPVELTVDQQALVALRRALDREADGKKLARELGKNLRVAVQPAVVEAKAAVRSIPAVQDVGLRSAIESNIKAQARLSGKSPGVKVRVGTQGMPRGFRLAGRRLNQLRGWRHPVFGRDVWVTQPGKPWFDPAMKKHRSEYRDAVLKAMEDMAKRIAVGSQK